MMKFEEIKMSDLILIEQTNALTVFTVEGQLDPILKKVSDDARSFVPNTSTDKGRKEIASMAYKVAQTKTYLDKIGKELVDEYKEIPKKIDASRKAARDFLDQLKEEVRKPLTDWEADQARIKEEEEARQTAIENQRVIDADYEIALILMERDFKSREEAEAERERLRLEHEENIRKQAAEQARLESERKAESDRLKAESDRLSAERRELEAKQAAQLAEQRRLQQEEMARKAAVDAENKRLADVEAARMAEVKRQQDAIAAEEAAKAKAAADLEHVKAVNNQIKAVYLAAGFSEEMAILAVKLLVTGKLPNTKFNY